MLARSLAALGGLALTLAASACSEPSPVPPDAPPVRPDPPACAPADHLLLCGAPLLIAHRGGGDLRPEATLPAYAHATELGADILEVDVHTTADGHVVCLHDETVDRTTDGTSAVHGLTLAEVRALDAGYRFSNDGGETFPYRGQGITIPTLDEVLAAHPTAWLSIEIKQTEPDIVADVIAVLDANDAASRVVLVSFDDEVVAAVRAMRPDIVTGMSAGEMSVFAFLRPGQEATYVPPTTIAQLPHALVTPAVIERATRYGVRLHVWTVNEPATMESLLDLGVHGIMTDDPALLADVLATR